MAKSFKIAQNPTFKETVKIPRVGGEPLEVVFEYKYLTRKELAGLQDDWNKATKEMIEKWTKAEDAERSLEEMSEDEINHNVKQLKDIVVGWNFSDEFNDENIRALVEATLHTTDSIVKAYYEAYAKAKVGN